MSFSRRSVFLSLGSLFLLNACKLVDQRTFNPSAGRRPLPYVPPAPPAPPPVPPPKPPIEIVAGTPQGQWIKPLTALVKDALQRKADALFIVTAVTPISQNPIAQQEAMTKIIAQNGQAVVEAIVKAGAKPQQVQLAAKADGWVQKNVIQVEIH